MPDVPAYATAFLKVEKEKEKVHNQEKRVSLTLKPCKFKTLFTQPGMMPDFQSKVENNKVISFILVLFADHNLKSFFLSSSLLFEPHWKIDLPNSELQWTEINFFTFS